MNNKGQALIEFVLILPVFLMILFIIVDFGMIFRAWMELESDSGDIVDLISDGMNVDDIKEIYEDVDIDVSDYGEELLRVELTSYVNVMTPGMDKILGDPYYVHVERVISNDSA